MRIRSQFFYGYWIVSVGSVVSALNSGCGFFAFSVFNKPIGDEFDWSRSAVTAAFLFFSVAFATGSFLVGRVTDERGPRYVLLLGTVTMVLALLLLSRTSAIWNFYLLYLILGIGVALTGPIPISVIVSNWFHRLRGTMQGIAFSGFGIGGLALAPVAGNYLIPNVGWRNTYLIMALLLVVIMLPLTVFVIKDQPHQKGLRAYEQEGDEAPDDNGYKTREATGLRLKEALSTPAFWIIVLTCAVYGMSMTAVLQNQVSILTKQGFRATLAILAIGGIGFFSAAGKLLFGYLCDHIDAKYAAAISYSLAVFSLLALIRASSMTHVWVYAILMGLAAGGWAPNLAMLSANYFGLKHYGTILGAMHLIFIAGEGVGPVLAGFVYDRTGSYWLILMVFLSLCLVSALLITTVRKPTINI